MSLPYLPPEIVSKIIDEIDKNDLINLRLVNKIVHSIANQPFALAFFKERIHVASPYSIKALVEITAHPFFGPFVETVTINGFRGNRLTPGSDSHSRPFPTGSSQTVETHFQQIGFLLSDEYTYLMALVFKNIKTHRNFVTIGICDNSLESFGSKRLRHLDFWEDTSLGAFRITEILNRTFAAARQTSCVLKSFKLSLRDSSLAHSRLSHLRRLLRNVKKSVGGGDERIQNINIEVKGTSPGQVVYDYETRCYKIEGNHDRPRKRIEELYQVAIQDLADGAHVSHLRIENCKFYEETTLLDCIFKRHSTTLETIFLEDVTFNSTATLKAVMEHLSRGPCLKTCRFGNVLIRDGSRGGRPKHLQFPGGATTFVFDEKLPLRLQQLALHVELDGSWIENQ